LWDAETGQEIRSFRGHTLPVYSVAFSPDGTRVLTGSEDGTAKLWDVETGQEISTFRGHMSIVTSVAFSPDGTLVLTGSGDRTAKLCDAETGQEIRTFLGHWSGVSSVAFSPDGTRVLTGGYDSTAKLWEAELGQEIRTFRGHTSGVYSVAFSPDGTQILTGSRDSTAKLWDAETGQEIRTFLGHTDWVNSVAFSPDGTLVLTGSEDGTARIWKLETASPYGGGTGEPINPYLIYTAEHLNAIGSEPNDWDKHFKLMADIDLSGYLYDAALIAPDVDTDKYYYQGTPYTGVFDGNGHTISHLTITGVSYLGLFGELASGAEVKDLGVVDVNISGSGDRAGGLLGHNRPGAIVIRCYSTGTVNGDDNIGGLVGNNKGHMIQCYSSSAVSGNYIVAGLLGANEGQAAVIDCYSTGAVNGDDAVAGLVGFNLGDVTRCCSAGTVTGDLRVGGLVGWTYGSIASSLWDIQTSGQTNMCGRKEEGASGCDDSLGKTTAEMQTAGTFLEAGWDFIDETTNGTEDIWWILEGQDYPRLWWETDNN
jgi:WD40 repeat protein